MLTTDPERPAPRSAGGEPSLEVSEIFSSVQGEGASAGKPALFVRLALCNLRCGWCDTKYTWDFKAYRYEDEVRTETAQSLLAILENAKERRVVITGGEPLVQQDVLGKLLAQVPKDVVVEIETNGTRHPDPLLLARVDQWNVSPKLGNSGESRERRFQPAVLCTLRDTGRAYLKLVVRGPADMPEVEELVRTLDFAPSRVLLMPQASTTLEYGERAMQVKALSDAYGYGFSPRLHVERWGGARGC